MGEMGPGEMLCPRCASVAQCELVDIGVGMQQVTPYHCEDCGWTETDEVELDRSKA